MAVEPPRSAGLDIPESILTDEFLSELEAEWGLSDEETRNCGTGAVGGKQGFQPGNKCAGSGEKSKGKAEDKKKDVHSDWDDGSTAGRYWDYGKNKKSYRSTISIDDEYEGERKYHLFSDVSNSRAAKSLMEIHDLEESPMYSFLFEDDEGLTEITNKGNAQKVFREVVNRGLSLFDEPNVGSVTFTAARYEQSRVKLYDFLSRFAEKRRKNLVAFADNNDKYHVKFHVVDRKYADDFKEWYKFDDKPIYPVDTYDGEYGEL